MRLPVVLEMLLPLLYFLRVMHGGLNQVEKSVGSTLFDSIHEILVIFLESNDLRTNNSN